MDKARGSVFSSDPRFWPFRSDFSTSTGSDTSISGSMTIGESPRVSSIKDCGEKASSGLIKVLPDGFREPLKISIAQKTTRRNAAAAFFKDSDDGEIDGGNNTMDDGCAKLDDDCIKISLPEDEMNTNELVDDEKAIFETSKSEGLELVDADRFDLAIERWVHGIAALSEPSKVDHVTIGKNVVLESSLNRLAVLHELCAQAYLQLDDLASALKYATIAVGYAPSWSEGHVTLARIQRESGRFEEALNSYDRAGELRLADQKRSGDDGMNRIESVISSDIDVDEEEMRHEHKEVELLVQRYRELRMERAALQCEHHGKGGQ